MTTANLAVRDEAPVVQYTSTGETAFVFPWLIRATSDIVVSVNGAVQVEGSDYTVSGVDVETGGTVTFLSATTSGEVITIWNDIAISRLTGFADGSAVLLATALNNEMIQVFRILLMLERDIGRALRLPIDDTVAGTDMELPAVSVRAGKFLKFADVSGAPEPAEVAVSGTVLSKSVITGYLYPTSAAETNAGVTITDGTRPYGDTRRYTGGLSDAISVAQDASATQDEKNIVFGADETIGSGVTITGSDITVRALGDATLTYTGTGDAVTLGASGTLARHVTWDVPILRSGQDWDDGTDTTSRGLVMVRCDQSTIWVDVEGFNDGFVLYGTGGGNVHNDIRVKHIQDCRRGFVADRPGTNPGWNNSNWVRAGLISWRSGTMDNACDNSIVFRAVDLVHASDNEIQFYGTAIEVGAGSAKVAAAESMLIRINGTFHRMLGCRIEVSNVTLTQYIRWDTSAQFNVIDGGRFPQSLAIATFVDDDATQDTNSLLNFGNVNRHGDTRAIIAGAAQFTGNPTSAQFSPDQPFNACLMAGPNTNSHANKIFAGIGASAAIVSSLTGTGRHGMGKDAETGHGYLQLVDPSATYKTESWNQATFHRSTSDATPVTINIDTITPPDGAGVWAVLKVVCFDDASSVGMSRWRSAFIQRIGTGNLAINAQANIFDHQDGGPFDAVFAISGTQLNIELTGIAATDVRWAGTLEWQWCSVDEAFPP